MDVKDLLLVVRPGAPNVSLYALAGGVARATGAFVRGLCMIAEPPVTVAESFARGSAAIDEVLAHRDQQIRAEATTAQAEFEQAMTAAGVKADWRCAEVDEAVETTSIRARYADLVVAAQPAAHDHDARALLEALVLTGGAPVLVVPPSASAAGLRRIVVAWDGGVAARRALDAAMPFLVAAQAVEIAVVQDGSAPEADDVAVDALVRRLARHGVRAEARRLGPGAGDAGAALLAHAKTFEADLLVMGAYGHSRAAEAIVGGVTRTVLAHADRPVLLAH